MTSKNPEVTARSKIKTAIKDLRLEQRVRVLADVLAAIGLPSFSGMLLESLAETKHEAHKDF